MAADDRDAAISGQREFGGFYPPRYTQVPDQLFDELLPDLSGAELKVLLYIIRRTFGFKKDHDRIALSQLVGGIRTRDGRVLDRGTGLHKATVITALKGLRAKGIIIAQRNESPERGHEETTYALRITTTPPAREAPRQALVAKNDKGLPEQPASLVADSGPQDTVPQETGAQETDRSNSRWAYAPVDAEDRAAILAYIDDFARELSDRARLRSSTSRALRLYRESGLTLDWFVKWMYVARNATKERRGQIRGSPMAYFFEVLENALKGKPPA